jgi:hypothetical protein
MRALLDVSLGSLEIAGALCGVPFVGAAAIILKDIVAACDGVRAHKASPFQSHSPNLNAVSMSRRSQGRYAINECP